MRHDNNKRQQNWYRGSANHEQSCQDLSVTSDPPARVNENLHNEVTLKEFLISPPIVSSASKAGAIKTLNLEAVSGVIHSTLLGRKKPQLIFDYWLRGIYEVYLCQLTRCHHSCGALTSLCSLQPEKKRCLDFIIKYRKRCFGCPSALAKAEAFLASSHFQALFSERDCEQWEEEVRGKWEEMNWWRRSESEKEIRGEMSEDERGIGRGEDQRLEVHRSTIHRWGEVSSACEAQTVRNE